MKQPGTWQILSSSALLTNGRTLSLCRATCQPSRDPRREEETGASQAGAGGQGETRSGQGQMR